METILLTSGGMRVKEEILKLLPKSPKNIKLAHIITASKKATELSWLYEDKQKMIDTGFQVEDIDIESKSPEKLHKLLSDKDIIYVQGGDPFYLLKHIRLTQFDKVVKELIQKDVIYIGASAGTWVAQPTIETALWSKPSRATYGITNYSGMNLVPILTMVHVGKDEKHSSFEYKERVKEGMKKYQYQIFLLTDSQAILFKDNKITLVGHGEKIEL